MKFQLSVHTKNERGQDVAATLEVADEEGIGAVAIAALAKIKQHLADEMELEILREREVTTRAEAHKRRDLLDLLGSGPDEAVAKPLRASLSSAVEELVEIERQRKEIHARSA